MHCHLLPRDLDMWRTCTVYKPSSAEGGHQCDRCHLEGITELPCTFDIKLYFKFLTSFCWNKPHRNCVFIFPYITETFWVKDSFSESYVQCSVRFSGEAINGCFPNPAIHSLSIAGPSPVAKLGSSVGWAAPVVSRTLVTCWWEWQKKKGLHALVFPAGETCQPHWVALSACCPAGPWAHLEFLSSFALLMRKRTANYWARFM